MRAILVLGVLAAVLVAVLTAWRAPDVVAISGYRATPTGPCGPADVDLLVKVKQAGLWEMPAAGDLATRGRDPKVRDAGRRIAAEHRDLNTLVDTAAAAVGVTLPDRATVEQEDWVRQIAAAPDPDALGVFLLRRAHGTVLPVLAAVRVGTRNATIRDLATQGLAFVGRHIGYLEATGLVDYTALPESPTPVPSLSPIKASYYYAADRPTLVVALLVLLGLALLVVGAALARRPVPPSRHARSRR